MKVWVLQGTCEGELFSSVHLTQKGCALKCVAEVLEFLEVDDEASAQRALEIANPADLSPGLSAAELAKNGWDYEKMKSLPSKQLWPIIHAWQQACWEKMSYSSFSVDGHPMLIEA